MPQSYRFKLIFSIEIGPHLIAFRILLGCGVMISEFSAAMELEELKARIQASYAKRRERIEEEIAVTETAIEDLEVLMIRNRRSYDEQTKRTNSMRKKPVTRLRKIIAEVENSAREIQRRIKLREQWLRANQCWIMVYQDVLQKKHERWRKEVNAMRLRLQAIEATEGFVYAVFGGGPSGLLRNQIKLEKAGPKASMLVQPLTKEDKIWLGQRRKDIESIITQPSCDRIKQIELQLRTSGLTTAETSSRCSSPVQPPGTHPLLKHHVQLKEAIQGDRDELRKVSRQLQQRLEEEKTLKEEWEKVFEKLRQNYSKSEQEYRNQMDEHNTRLKELQAIEATEGFVYAVFGGGPSGLLRNQIKLEKAGPKASMLVQPLTKEDKIWLGQRRKDIESIITQPSCDRIKQIELQLRTSGLTTAETSSRCSSPVQPPGTHPLLKHHVQLKEAIQGDRDELRKVSRQLQQRLEEEKTLKEEWEKVFEKLRQNYSKSEQEYRNQMDEHNTRLKELNNQMQQLHLDEAMRLQNAALKYMERKQFIQDLNQEFAFLGVSQSFGRWHRDGYFDNRFSSVPPK
ncbi:hypothetical protein CSKR_109246 [Clonorchis sinensis]|uniref:Uncharacterized protein n=1 Tax=Clonorchis sinensis TaxID=79923 RepID=A0A3R7HBC5_CLOSI|nr:hypothetical protein CSKR_109246 [Clonorchis sinensis]